MRVKIILLMSLLLVISGGVMAYLLFFSKEQYTASKKIEQLPATVFYTDAIVKEFEEIQELYSMKVKLNLMPIWNQMKSQG